MAHQGKAGTDKQQHAAETEDMRAQRMQWWHEARFGMFIHWGVYAQLGRAEWVMNRERIPIEEYERLADTWRPKPDAAREWARLARQAGMRYIVLTTRHHDGFCLFDSALTGYTAAARGPRRDLVKEYVDAVRAEGLRVGFYFSLMDWHDPDHSRCLHDETARRRYVDRTHGLLRELFTNYGKIDILWYDGDWPLDAKGWESEKLNAMVRSLQPGILINNRSGTPEDFGTPEGEITPAKDGRPWEACMTFYDGWGYTPAEVEPMAAWRVVDYLRRVAQGGGNLLLNIGPKPDGSVKDSSVAALCETGRWLRQYGACVYEATDPMPQENLWSGAFTRKGNTLYYLLHERRWPGTELVISGLACRVTGACHMNGPAIRFTQTTHRLVLHDLPERAPDPVVSVIELQVEGDIRQVIGIGYESDNPAR